MHGTGQMAWVGHDSFRLWHHFVVAVASEQNKELPLPGSFLWGGGPRIKRVALPHVGPHCLGSRPTSPYPVMRLLVDMVSL